MVQLNQFLSPLGGNQAKHDVVHQTENRRIRPDPQRQGRQCDNRKHRVLPQSSQGVEEVSFHCSFPRQSPCHSQM
jgi:hypothetical protein